MDIDFSAWLGLALRWFHVMAGIMWIGTSFYYIWLGNALKPPANKEPGVEGEVWAVHGGGFYHKKKYAVAPEHMPEDLHWFKWEAYLTWISGIALLVLIYYMGAHMYLIDRAKLDMGAAEASLIGIASIVVGWIVYDALCKSDIGKNNKLFGLLWFGLLMAAAYALTQVFTGRGAFIHLGAIIGTVMAANVFAIIIPNQKKTVAALLEGKKPDPKLGKKAGQRSLHNNYMTLPVLLIMISSHYPVLIGHPYNWLVLAGLSAASWSVREFFNRMDRGAQEFKWLVGGIGGGLVVIMLASVNLAPADTKSETVSAAEVRSIVRKHCSACHSDQPTHASLTAAPGGVKFDTMDEIKKHAARIEEQSVKTETMPLGNETGMTAEERKKLGDGLRQLPR